MELWQRLLVIGIVLALTALATRVIDRRIMGTDRSPQALTRYRVLRRSIAAVIVTIGVLSALLVIPQIRAVAGGLLASSAVLGLILGFASQRTLGNFVAGLMIAMTQPLRLGDWIEVGGSSGVVEEIGLMYTFIRAEDNSRLVIPNEKLASDTIRNSTIRSAAKFAEVSVQVPPTADLRSLASGTRSSSAPSRPLRCSRCACGPRASPRPRSSPTSCGSACTSASARTGSTHDASARRPQRP
jgi:small-conductance mechanosensitive channel